MTEIGSSAFRYCEFITEIFLPQGITILSDYVFDGCTRLKEISIPPSIVTIGNGAFQNCKSITELTVGFNVTLIGNYAFAGCDSLRKVNFSNPNGWVTAYSAIQEGGTPIEVSTLSSPSRAASYVRGDSSKWYLKRIVETND